MSDRDAKDDRRATPQPTEKPVQVVVQLVVTVRYAPTQSAGVIAAHIAGIVEECGRRGVTLAPRMGDAT